MRLPAYERLLSVFSNRKVRKISDVIGFTTRHSDDDNINASLSGSSFQFVSAGDDSVQGGFVGGNLRFHTTDQLDVLADVEYREASGDENEITARLRLEYRF